MRLEAGTVTDYLVARGLVPRALELTVEELAGGVSGTVLAVRGPGVALVVKQALPRLRVAEEWIAPARRTDTEAAALRLAARLIPGRVAPVVDSDESEHVLVLQHAPRRLAQLAGRVARRPRACGIRPLGAATRSAACTRPRPAMPMSPRRSATTRRSRSCDSSRITES